MKKVLIVDHLEPFLEQETRILSNRGLQILTATSGEEAIAVHKKDTVNLIVTALNMPEMSGDKLCSQIRRDKGLKSVSVIILCENKKADLDRCARCGANSFVTRPLDPAQLLEKVSQLIDIPKRSGMRVLIKVFVKGKLKSQAFFCTSVNISKSGILLEVDRALSKDDLITCAFFVPGADSITVDCEITRMLQISKEIFHCGAKFLNLSPRQVSSIEAFVRKKNH